MDEDNRDQTPGTFAEMAEGKPSLPKPGFTTIYSLVLLLALAGVNIFFM